MKAICKTALSLLLAGLLAGCAAEMPAKEPAVPERPVAISQGANEAKTENEDKAGQQDRQIGGGEAKPEPVIKPPVKPATAKEEPVDPERAALKLPPVTRNMAFSTGDKIPDFTLADLNGNKRASGDLFSGSRITVLNFWATF